MRNAFETTRYSFDRRTEGTDISSEYACMYACMYVGMYVRMYVGMYVLCTYVCTYVDMYVLCTYVRMYLCMYVLCTYVCMYVGRHTGKSVQSSYSVKYMIHTLNSFFRNFRLRPILIGFLPRCINIYVCGRTTYFCHFPAVLCRSETWSFTLMEEHSLRVFENSVLRRILGPKWDEVRRQWRKLHNEKLNLYSSPNFFGCLNQEE